MNVSLICACKNRKRALYVSLASWLLCDEIKEIIVVDWSSDSDQTLNEISELDDRIKIINVLNEKYFNLPHPLNLAASFATQDYILKVDCDYVFNPYHNFFESYSVDENSFVSGHSNLKNPEKYNEEWGITTIKKNELDIFQIRDYVNCYSPFYIYLKGMLLVSRKNFEKIGGYDENFDTFYAYDDDNIRDRLLLLGLKHHKLNYDYHLIHIPHSDYIRLEHFKGFHETGEKEHMDQMEEGDAKWNYAYYLASCHIKKNIELYSDPVTYQATRKLKWKIQKIDEQHYYAEKTLLNNKLEGFPTVCYISLSQSSERRKKLESSFSEYSITPKSIISEKFSDCNDVVTGKYAHTLNDGTKGCGVSQLKAIKEWYENTNEECLFVCEDDLSLETVKYWNFTWKEFYDSLPSDWNCVQLVVVRDDFDTYELRERMWDDWSVTGYLIRRSHASKIIEDYCKEDSYHFEIPNCNIQPLVENLIFTVGKTYARPLFVENVEMTSTFIGMDDDVKEGQKNNHCIANEKVLNYWKSKKCKASVIKTQIKAKNDIEELLTKFSLDTENPELNFDVALWYEKKGHNAPALTYFLRCAERTEEKLLAYESLIHASNCYDRQGTRDQTAKGILQQAMCLCPERPEARFLLSKFSEKREYWQDCYIYASEALDNCDFDCTPLLSYVEYPGIHALLFEKAISSWWWGKNDQCKKMLLEIKENYDLDENFLNLINQNLEKIGG
jgi:hypothetical protein